MRILVKYALNAGHVNIIAAQPGHCAISLEEWECGLALMRSGETVKTYGDLEG